MIPGNCLGWQKLGRENGTFLCLGTKKHGSGGRPNRTTQNGFWKATGSDRKILSISDPKKVLGLKKTLVFYEGRAPRGRKTDWIMNEYRLPDKCSPPKDIVLCKIYRKATSLKVLEQRAAMEEGTETGQAYCSPSPPMDSISFCNQFDDVNVTINESNNMGLKKENEDINILVEEKYGEVIEESSKGRSCCLILPTGTQDIADLQVPKLNMDWTQDSFWTQLNSPWLENFPHFLQMY